MPSAQLQTLPNLPSGIRGRCSVAVLWIDWYAYHVARFEGLRATPELAGQVVGIEMVGGIGVHAGLKFREDLPPELAVETLLPHASWQTAGQLRLARAVWQVLDRLQPEVVLVPGYYTLPAVAAAAWARLNRRTSVLMTESTAADHARNWWKERLKSLVIRSLFDWAVAGGSAHVRYLRQLGFPAARIARFYDVVQNETYRERAAELRRDHAAAEFGLPDHPYFLYVGRLAPEKNVLALVSAWLRYREGGGTWPLVLVGDGPSAGSLRDAAGQSPWCRDIHFAGHRGSRDLPAFYAFAGCFVLPSTREPWGLVVNEAMASGLPVIVSDRCGCAEDLVAQGRNGLVFDPSDERQLADCLGLLAGFDAGRLAAMGRDSLERIALYSPANFGREIARIVSQSRPEPAPDARFPGARQRRSKRSAKRTHDHES